MKLAWTSLFVLTVACATEPTSVARVDPPALTAPAPLAEPTPAPTPTIPPVVELPPPPPVVEPTPEPEPPPPVVIPPPVVPPPPPLVPVPPPPVTLPTPTPVITNPSDCRPAIENVSLTADTRSAFLRFLVKTGYADVRISLISFTDLWPGGPSQPPFDGTTFTAPTPAAYSMTLPLPDYKIWHVEGRCGERTNLAGLFVYLDGGRP